MLYDLLREAFFIAYDGNYFTFINNTNKVFCKSLRNN